MSIYDLNKFQVNNDSWITIKNTIINVSESKVKDENRKAAGKVIYLLTMRENSDNYELSHDENTIINVSESKVKDESRKAAGNVIDLLTMRENS